VKNSQISYKNFIQKKHLSKKLQNKLNKNFLTVYKNIFQNLNKSHNTLFTLSDKFKLNFKKKDFKIQKKYQKIVVIGMGGSIYGSKAIYFFFKKKIKKKFIFLDDLDEEKLKELKNKNNLKSLLFIVISKSGNTIETLSNLLALKIIKKNAKNLIIISEKSNNSLFSIAKKMKLIHIEHQKSVGGRFSVFSDVGMIPTYFMDLNLSELRKNLLKHIKKKNKKYLKDSAISLANLFIRKKFKNLIFLNYMPRLEKFLYWNQQLIAESLGKKGKGFLPLISQAPKDHHSLLQLYSDGPKDKIFYIFSEDNINSTKIKTNHLEKKLNFLNNKKISSIKILQKNSLIQVLKNKKIPFREFKIKDDSERVLGELFSYFILETVFIGKLANINPFDQPGVEQVKIITKKLLG
jgi:glucose-6-phosphate isomerase